MIIVPMQWIRNKSTGVLCVITRVAGQWVHVRYRSGKEDRHHIDKIIKGYENCLPPAPRTGRKG